MKTLNMLLVVACCFLFIHCDISPDNNHYIKDVQGRIVIHHGINICNSSKGSPFLPWQQEKDFKRLQDWGFNFVRYLIFWEAIEPTENHYDTAYMSATLIRLKQLKALGIDVVIDFHQDLYAEKFTGNGFPAWTINDHGIPFHQQTPWNLNYLEPAVITSYNEFWKTDSLKQKYINVVKYALSWFDSLVIGVDVMNEPFPGTNIKFEQTVLTDLYTKIQNMIQQNKFKAKMFFEPWMCTSAGIPTQLKFKPDSTCVYFPHYYDPLTHEGKPYQETNRLLMLNAIPCKVGEAQKFGVPMTFGEFAVTGNIVQNGYLKYLDDFLGLADKFFFGWTYYSYERGQVVDDSGNTDTVVMPKLIQIYAQRIAGINPKIDRQPKSFCLTYNACGLKDPTIIFIPSSYKKVSVGVNNQVAPFNEILFYHIADTGKQSICVQWE